MGIIDNLVTQKDNAINKYINAKNNNRKLFDTTQNIGSILLAGGAGYYTTKILDKKLQQPVSLMAADEFIKDGNILNEKEILHGFKKTKLYEDYGVYLHDYSEGYPCFRNRQVMSQLKKECEIYSDREKSMKMLKRIQEHPKLASVQCNIATFFLTPIQAIKTLQTKIANKILSTKISQKIFANIAETHLEMYNAVLQGQNAFFMPHHNDIHINIKNLSGSAFHEIGHVMNWNKNGIGKILSKVRNLKMLIPLIAATALINNPNKHNESKSGINKCCDFIKEHSIGLSLLCLAPIPLEEGLASIKGAKLAKSIISKEKLKRLNNFHGKAWLTYAAATATSFAAIFAIDKVRNLTAPRG